MNPREYFAHVLIGTPLAPIARRAQRLATLPQRAKHPELRDVYAEPLCIAQAMARIVHDPMNCIDVGAHLGSVLSEFRQLSPHGHHIAVEPVPYKCRWLRRKFRDVEVFQLALDASHGEAEFMLQVNRSAYSGLRLHGGRGQHTNVLRVVLARLDDIVSPDRHIGFIKIDVEGAELRVLLGGQDVLDRCRPLVLFECTLSGLSTYNISAADVFQFFHSRSYSLFMVSNWLRNEPPLTYERFLRSMQYPFQAFNFLGVPRDHRPPTLPVPQAGITLA